MMVVSAIIVMVMVMLVILMLLLLEMVLVHRCWAVLVLSICTSQLSSHEAFFSFIFVILSVCFLSLIAFWFLLCHLRLTTCLSGVKAGRSTPWVSLSFYFVIYIWEILVAVFSGDAVAVQVSISFIAIISCLCCSRCCFHGCWIFFYFVCVAVAAFVAGVAVCCRWCHCYLFWRCPYCSDKKFSIEVRVFSSSLPRMLTENSVKVCITTQMTTLVFCAQQSPIIFVQSNRLIRSDFCNVRFAECYVCTLCRRLLTPTSKRLCL